MSKPRKPFKPFPLSDDAAMRAGMLIERPDQRTRPLVSAIRLALLRASVAKTAQAKEA